MVCCPQLGNTMSVNVLERLLIVRPNLCFEHKKVINTCFVDTHVLRSAYESPLLANCHARMADAGCVVSPEWTVAKLPAPVTEEMLSDIPGFRGQLKPP